MISRFISLIPSCSKRETCGWPSRTYENGTDVGTGPASIKSDDLAGIPRPRRSDLATGKELQDGRVDYTSAKTLSRIRGFRKGLIVALLLDLDTVPSTSNVEELWAKKKPDLAKMLWDMVRRLFGLWQPLASYLISESFLAPKWCSTESGNRSHPLPCFHTQ